MRSLNEIRYVVQTNKNATKEDVEIAERYIEELEEVREKLELGEDVVEYLERVLEIIEERDYWTKEIINYKLILTYGGPTIILSISDGVLKYYHGESKVIIDFSWDDELMSLMETIMSYLYEGSQ